MKPKHPGGRPISYRPEFCRRVVALMAEGRSLEGCAALLGVHPDSLNEWQKVHPQFSVAVRAGRAAATTYWENRLLAVSNGEPGNAQAIQWALRNRSRAASGCESSSAFSAMPRATRRSLGKRSRGTEQAPKGAIDVISPSP